MDRLGQVGLTSGGSPFRIGDGVGVGLAVFTPAWSSSAAGLPIRAIRVSRTALTRARTVAESSASRTGFPPGVRLRHPQGRHLGLAIHALHQRTREPAPIALDLGRGTSAGMARVACPQGTGSWPPGAGIGRGSGCWPGPGHGDLPGLQGPAQDLPDRTLELGALVQERDTGVGPGDLAGSRWAAPPIKAAMEAEW